MVSLEHPKLGKIQGVEEDGVNKYLGIKFASLENRLGLPELVAQSASGGVIDATKLGPSTEQWPIGIDVEFGLIQQSLEKYDLPVSATEGLNANIILPAGCKSNDRLPVLVWVYGGGFMHGSNSWPQWDLTRLVKLSKEHGTPMVGVAINYRLGVPGFLTSSEMTNAGIKANRGLLDQTVGFRWVRQFIDGFGGDSANVTAMGQSAGAASLMYLLNSKDSLFDRLIALGGNSVGLKPLPPFLPENIVYPAVMKSLGLESLSASERIQKLNSMPFEDIIQNIPPGLPLMAVNDDDLLPPLLTFASLRGAFPKDHWCKELFVGDCALDSSVFGELALEKKRKGIGKAFAASLRESLKNKPDAAETILKAYGINESSPNDDSDFLAICQFAADIAYDAGSEAWAKEWTSHGGSYRYYFNVPNPWPGKWQGHSTHILDVAYLFQTFNEKLSAEERATAKKMAGDVISFVAGKGVKPDFQKDGIPSVVYGKKAEAAGADSETGRKEIIPQIVAEKQVSLDDLLGAWFTFMQS